MINKTTKEYIIILGYLIALTVVVLNHELWRDEFQAWLIALKSSSLSELFANLRYEGHPGLWHLCLYFITRFTDNPIFMQMFHICLAVITIWILIRFSSFSLPQKFLLAFGYFFFYEYAVISRNYILSVMLVFLFCAVYSRRQDAVIPLSLILAFLAQTTFYGMLISLLLTFLLLAEAGFNRELRSKLLLIKNKCIFATLIFMVGIYFSLFQIIPPQNTGYFQGWHFYVSSWRMAEAFQIILDPFLPLHTMDAQFWFNSIVKSFYLRLLLSAILFVTTAMFFIKKPAILLCYLTGVVGYVSFSYIKMIGEMNHNGYIFILFIALLWLTPYFTTAQFTIELPNWVLKRPKVLKNLGAYFLMALFTVHFVSGVSAAMIDLKYPFSASKDVFEFLKKDKSEDKVLAGDKDYAITSIAGYLNREIYYPRKGDYGTFIIWNIERKKDYDEDTILNNIYTRFSKAKKDGILVFNYKIQDDLMTKYHLKKIREFKKSIVWDEKFYLYFMEFPS
jgi:hypothetical protein